jgi:hypothetical protein
LQEVKNNFLKFLLLLRIDASSNPRSIPASKPTGISLAKVVKTSADPPAPPEL